MKGLYDCAVNATSESMNKTASTRAFMRVMFLVHSHAEGAKATARAAIIQHSILYGENNAASTSEEFIPSADNPTNDLT